MMLTDEEISLIMQTLREIGSKNLWNFIRQICRKKVKNVELNLKNFVIIDNNIYR
jgi:hypothetical protein